MSHTTTLQEQQSFPQQSQFLAAQGGAWGGRGAAPHVAEHKLETSGGRGDTALHRTEEMGADTRVLMCISIGKSAPAELN